MYLFLNSYIVLEPQANKRSKQKLLGHNLEHVCFAKATASTILNSIHISLLPSTMCDCCSFMYLRFSPLASSVLIKCVFIKNH